MGLVEDVAAAPSVIERSRVKAEALAALPALAGRSVTRGRFTVTILDAPRVVAHKLVFRVRIERDGIDVTPPDLNPIEVTNPPVLVEDPAGSIVRTWNDPQTGIPRSRRLRLDPPAAMLQIVRDLVT